MHPDVFIANETVLGTQANEIEFTFYHSWKREKVDCEIVEWVGDGDFEPHTVDDGQSTVIGVTSSGDLILVTTSDGSVFVFTDIDLIRSRVSNSVAEFLNILVIEPA